MKKHVIYNGHIFKLVIRTLIIFNDTNIMKEKSRKALFHIFFEAATPTQFIKNIQAFLIIIDSGNVQILNEQTLETLTQDTLPLLITSIFDRLLNKENIAIYYQIFTQFRQPSAFITYLSKLYSLQDLSLLICLQDKYMQPMYNGVFAQERYNLAHNPHLKKIDTSNPGIIELWKKKEYYKVKNLDQTQDNPEFLSSEWLKQKLVNDKHLDLSLFPHVSNILQGKDLPLQEQSASHQDIEQVIINLYIETDVTKQLMFLKEIKTILQFSLPASDFLNDVISQINVLSSPNQYEENLYVVDTDDPEDLLLCGMEVPGSCQRVDGNPHTIKCLLAYLVDGKNRLIAVKYSSTKKILSRAIIRLLWNQDMQAPVMFLERCYVCNPKHEEFLVRIALKKAQHLGIPLTTQEPIPSMKEVEQCTYPHSLYALSGGPAPYEYVDACNDICHVEQEGFKINNATLLRGIVN